MRAATLSPEDEECIPQGGEPFAGFKHLFIWGLLAVVCFVAWWAFFSLMFNIFS